MDNADRLRSLVDYKNDEAPQTKIRTLEAEAVKLQTLNWALEGKLDELLALFQDKGDTEATRTERLFSGSEQIDSIQDQLQSRTQSLKNELEKDHLFKFGRVLTAVMIGTSLDDIMGNPFANPDGWNVKINLDPGKTGQPSLGLDFKFSKDGTDSNNAEHYNSFAVGWEPGVRIEDKFQMENFHAERATQPTSHELLPFTFPAALQKLCKRQEDADRLVCVTFRSNAHKSSPMNVEWAKALKNGTGDIPYNNLKRMYSAEDPSHYVSLWFMTLYHIPLPRLYARCIQPFTNAVKEHTPPFHVHLDEDDELMTNLDPKSDLEATETEPIPTLEDIDALRAENLKLKTENNSLQTLMRDQNKKIEKLADDLRQAHKERDNIIQTAEKMKHQRELKPKQIQKALNEISKILK